MTLRLVGGILCGPAGAEARFRATFRCSESHLDRSSTARAQIGPSRGKSAFAADGRTKVQAPYWRKPVSKSVEAATTGQESSRVKRRPSLFSFIVAGFVSGVALGLFLGDYTAKLRILGEVYVGMLQMAVLPYIVFALIASIGRLSLTEGKRLARYAISVLALLWAIGCITVALTALAFPRVDTGAFFSTSLVERTEKVNLVSLFVPSNPFESLANNIVPAVVVFSILFGVALVRVQSKEDLLKVCDTIVATLSRVNGFIVKVSPIGIFAISAAAAGTLSLHEFGRLQAYLLSFTLSVLLIAFWVLPMLIAACTPFRYRDILAVSKNALFTAFVVGSLFVVIPMLAEGAKQLLDRYYKEGVDTAIHPEFVIPIGYTFPDLGKVLTLLFIPFAAWFYGKPLAFTDYPAFLGTGLLLSFGKVTATIPFLLDMQKLPSDIFQLFLLSGVFAGRFGDLIGGMHLLAFTTLTTCAMAGLIRVKRTKLTILVLVTALLGSVMVGASRLLIAEATGEADQGRTMITGMQLLNRPVASTILKKAEPNPIPLAPGQSRLDRIHDRGVIRVGFQPDNIPYSYFNIEGKLVGFDIDMAHRLAGDLEVEVEFVPFENEVLARQLEDDHFDIAMSGIPAAGRRATKLWFSEPYMDVTIALVVRDHDDKAFSNIDRINRLPSFTLGMERGTLFLPAIRVEIPRVEIVELESEGQFFRDPPRYMDALLVSAEAGSAWTLLYPEYQVVNPLPYESKVPMAYPHGGPDKRFEEFLDAWIRLAKIDGTTNQLYDHWILGRGAQVRERRWSIMRDVLNWVD